MVEFSHRDMFIGAETRLTDKRPINTDLPLREFLADLNFITFEWDPILVPHPIFVKIGDDRVEHLALLAELYPRFEFHLYSSKKLSDKSRVKSYHSPTLQDLERWVSRNDVYLSMNRSTVNDDMTVDEGETANVNDLRKMIGWWSMIGPVACLMKFRPPRTILVGKEVSIPHGKLMFGAYGRRNSLTTYLMIGQPLNEDGGLGRTSSHPYMSIDIQEYINLLAYHNKVRRTSSFANPMASGTLKYDEMLKYDDAFTMESIINYFDKTNVVITPVSVKRMKNLLGVTLHSKADYRPKPLEELKRTLRTHNLKTLDPKIPIADIEVLLPKSLKSLVLPTEEGFLTVKHSMNNGPTLGRDCQMILE